LTDVMTMAFEQIFHSWNVARSVVNDLGRGTVLYEGVQAIAPPELTVWGV